MRRLGGFVLALALISCDMLPGAQPKGPATDLERQVTSLLAPNADIVDQPFEDLLALLDLQKTYGDRASEMVDQIRKTRTAVASARTNSSARGRVGLASVARSIGTFSVPQFAFQFGYSLDELTKSGGTRQSSAPPYNNQETAREMFTTTTLNATEIFTGSGAHVTGTLKWSYSTITIETATGATLLHITDDRTLVGGIEVCPDPIGNVPASLDTNARIVAQVGTLTTTFTSTGTTTFQGSVDEQAALRSVTQKTHSESTTGSSSGSSGYSSDLTATWNAGRGGDYIGSLASGSVTAALTASGATSAADAARGAGWGLALDAYALEAAYKAAQDLWRHGRCVVVVAPDYNNAQTPVRTEAQNESQHDEAVEVSSETKFSVNLKHRFGGSVSAPITAVLTSGQKTLEPNRLESSGSLTYKAPDEEDKKATAKLQSTSKRGIGTLVLDFHTGGGLTLTLTGELSGNDSSFATVRILDRLTIGPLEFKKTFGDLWEAKGTWRAEKSSFTAALGETQTCTGSESGDVTMMARVEKRGDRTVWVVDPLDSDATGKGSLTCEHSLGGTTLRGVTLPRTTTHDSDGDSASLFIGILDTIVIPQEGGRVPVRGSQGTFTASGTATATTGN